MKFLVVAALGTLSLAACDAGPEGFDRVPGFRLTINDENDAVLEASNEYQWWWNSIADADYQGWPTEFDAEGWRSEAASARIELIQLPELYLSARLELSGQHDLDFVNTSQGFGWREVTPAEGDIRPFDLHRADLAPSSDDLDDEDLVHCEVADTRILAALSKYPDSMDTLIEEAVASAAAQGLPEPTTWSDIVHDEQMYEYLFGAHKTQTMEDVTFAFVALQIDPLCGSLRMTFRTESDLVGPVELVDGSGRTDAPRGLRL